MNKIFGIFLIIFLNSCSFDTKSGIWTQEKKIQAKKTNFNLNKEKDILKKEFNKNLKIKLDHKNMPINDPDSLTNNMGVFNFRIDVKKFSRFKFSKIEKFNYFEPEIVSDGKNFIFFDDKSNILKFDSNFKTVWKKNFYSKQEKKLKPILNFAIHKKKLVVVDNIGKIYLIDTNTGNLIWKKTNINPFNSQIKINKNKIFVMDMNNILRCISIQDGKELWKFNSENTFLKSNKRNSLAIYENKVFFNNSLGDIIALNSDNGSLIWQTPTQSSDIYENAFGLINSDIVIKNNNLVFSNNRNEFYSLNVDNGLLNWKQSINSEIRSIIYKKLAFTFSNEGYFFVIDTESGNILRITDVFDIFSQKKRVKIKPVGFIMGKEKIMLTTNTGRLLIIDISKGKTEKLLNIDNEKISRPFIFNKSIILVKNNSVIRLN